MTTYPFSDPTADLAIRNLERQQQKTTKEWRGVGAVSRRRIRRFRPTEGDRVVRFLAEIDGQRYHARILRVAV